MSRKSIDQSGQQNECLELAHDLRQPLNVIRTTAENVRRRIAPKLIGDDLDYLQAKLARIDQQIDKAEEILKSAH